MACRSGQVSESRKSPLDMPLHFWTVDSKRVISRITFRVIDLLSLSLLSLSLFPTHTPGN